MTLLPVDHRHDVILTHDHQLLVVDLDLSPAVFAEQHPVTHFYIRGTGLTVLQDLSLTHGDHLSEGRFLAGGVRNDNPAGGLALLSFTLDDNAVVQWTDVHGTSYLTESKAIHGLNWHSICTSANNIHAAPMFKG